MASGGQDFRELQDALQDVVRGRVNDASTTADVAYRLRQALPRFLAVLDFKGPSQEARQKLSAGTIETSEGPFRLSATDIAEATVLSDGLQLDELLCAGYLDAAQKQGREVSAEAAAGVYMEDRAAQLECLHFLLQAQALPTQQQQQQRHMPEPASQALASATEHLLAPHEGRHLLLERLIHLTKASLTAGSTSSSSGRLQWAVDGTDQQVPMQRYRQHERSLLCECLAFAACIQPHVGPGDVIALASLLEEAATMAAGHPQAAGSATLICVAVLLVIIPSSNDINEGSNDHTRYLGTLADNDQLAMKLKAIPPSAPALMQLLSFAWGTILSVHGPDDSHDEAANLIFNGIDGGLLRFVISDWLRAPWFRDQGKLLRQLQAQALYQLLMLFLESPPVRQQYIEALLETDVQQSADEDAQQQQLQLQLQRPPDSISSLLSALAGVFAVHPALGLDENLRAPVFEEFMDYVGRHPAMDSCPPILVAYLGVLTSLAHDQQGAEAVHGQLAHSGAMYAALSWERLFDIMKGYCQRYSQEGHLQEQAQQQAYDMGPQAGQQRPARPQELMVPDSDTRALAAYLRLLTRVVGRGNPQRVVAWLGQWEVGCGVAPLWELLLQLMCYPVPQELKAALDEALAAMAPRSDAKAMWERLLSAVVVQPFPAPDATMQAMGVVPQCDIIYQLHEIEMRTQRYPETLAFVRLLNALLKCSGDSLGDCGFAYRHYTHFVRVHVFGHIAQRAYSDGTQQWELAAACLEHMRLALELLLLPQGGVPPHMSQGFAASNALHATPGLAVMQDLLGEGEAARALWALLMGAGPGGLAAERQQGVAGREREGAVLAGLRLLRSAFERDQEAASVLSLGSGGTAALLDASLQKDRRRLPAVLQWAPADGHGSSLPDIVHGFADCLWAGFNTPATSTSLADDDSADDSAPPDESPSGGDPRALLVLQLLNDCAWDEAPSLTHMLLGMDVGGGYAGVANSELELDGSFSCLSVLLHAVQLPALAVSQPEAYEAVLALLHALVCAEASAPPLLRLLCMQGSLAPLLDTPSDIASSSLGVEALAGLKQSAELLGLLSQQLHSADAAIPPYQRLCRDIVADLFLAPEPEPGTELPRGQNSRMLALLECAALPLDEPQLDAECRGEVRQLQQRLGVDELLASSRGVGEGGVRTSHHSLPCYDIPALLHFLQQRAGDQEKESQRYGGSGAQSAANTAAIKAACKAALSTAQKWNAWVQACAAQASLLAAWEAVLEVTITRRSAMLATAAAAAKRGESQATILQGLLHGVLNILSKHAKQAGFPVAAIMAQAARCILQVLHAQAVAGFGKWPDPLAVLRPRYHPWMRVLVSLLRPGGSSGGQREEVKVPLMGALLSYLLLCGAGSLDRLPGPVLQALLEGMGLQAGQTAVLMEEAQRKVQGGNAAIVTSAPWLVDIITAEASRASMHQASGTLALMLLGSLVAAESSSVASASAVSPSHTMVAEAICRTGLPDSMLQDLASCGPSLTQQAGGKALRGILVAEAQLHLLLALTQSGRVSQAAALALPPQRTIALLSQCQILELQSGAGEWRQRSQQYDRTAGVATGLLRLLVAAQHVQRANKGVQAEALAFAQGHRAALTALLQSAGSATQRDDSTDLHCLEHGRLVITFLSSLLTAQEPQITVPLELQEGVMRLVHRMDQGSLQKLGAAIGGVRSALLAFLRQLVMNPKASWLLPIAAPPPHDAPSLLLLRETLYQADVDLAEAVAQQLRLQDALRTQAPATASASHEANGAGAGALVVRDAEGQGARTEGRHLSRLSLASSAAACDREVGRLLYIVENALAIILHHMLHPKASELGSARDLQQMVRLLRPLLDQLARYDDAVLRPSHDTSALQALVRRARDRLFA
ncbi:hypothetical protein WJX73_001060 [Symbiochloris irregularis]|uniref:Nuclear pore complex protein Nup205 n=1 Tax=Symbiochloris irregularis TaxID=706552 RepID=A0AAW1NNU1_9CHLO